MIIDNPLIIVELSINNNLLLNNDMTSKKIDKKVLVALIIENLEQELSQAINAANQAHAAAVDDQSVAETQYDTLAIEASYLAEGQSRRVQVLQGALLNYQELTLVTFDENKPIALSALVQLFADSKKQHWFFIGPAAGGFRCQLNEQHITVITPKSPIGVVLMREFEGDNIDVMLGNGRLTDYIASVY
jgi:transcription elongation GreA/GreB family factor